MIRAVMTDADAVLLTMLVGIVQVMAGDALGFAVPIFSGAALCFAALAVAIFIVPKEWQQ